MLCGSSTEKALTIVVRTQANREERKADNLDDSTSPHEKSFCGSCHRNVARLWKHMVEYDYCDQWHHYVCVGIRASDAEFINSFTQVIISAMVNDHEL